MTTPNVLPYYHFKAPEGKYYLHSEKVFGMLPFHHLRNSKLTLATPVGVPDEGPWVLFNSSEFIHIHRHDSMKKEPARALCFASSTSKPAYPTCHAFTPSKDGPDLLVGLFDGSVELVSLKAQFKQAATSTKVLSVARVAPEADQESAYCAAVAWVPKSDLFAVACASGSIYLYKKSAVVGESGSKFLGLGSSNKNVGPVNTISACPAGLNDMSISPDGTRIAVACKDGALRILDLASGAVVGGVHAYYGAMLCCSFSQDGKYVAAGGEDDMVVVYGMQEKCPIAHCEGHRSWVSSVCFDPWVQLGGMYRIASVGQDTQMCLWEVQGMQDGEPGGNLAFNSSIKAQQPRKSGSQASLLTAGWHGNDSPTSAVPLAPKSPGRAGNNAGNGGANINGVLPSPPRSEMVLYEPVMEHKLHQEPVSDVLATEHIIYTVDYCGCMKGWKRPVSKPGVKSGGKE